MRKAESHRVVVGDASSASDGRRDDRSSEDLPAHCDGLGCAGDGRCTTHKGCAPRRECNRPHHCLLFRSFGVSRVYVNQLRGDELKTQLRVLLFPFYDVPASQMPTDATIDCIVRLRAGGAVLVHDTSEPNDELPLGRLPAFLFAAMCAAGMCVCTTCRVTRAGVLDRLQGTICLHAELAKAGVLALTPQALSLLSFAESSHGHQKMLDYVACTQLGHHLAPSLHALLDAGLAAVPACLNLTVPQLQARIRYHCQLWRGSKSTKLSSLRQARSQMLGMAASAANARPGPMPNERGCDCVARVFCDHCPADRLSESHQHAVEME